MLNRRYLGWLIAAAYVAPHGPFSRLDAVAAASAARLPDAATASAGLAPGAAPPRDGASAPRHDAHRPSGAHA